MKSAVRHVVMAAMFLSSAFSVAATVRGQLICDQGKTPATGIAVTAKSPQGGRTEPSFTGGDGMYYLTLAAGPYTLEVWLSRQAKTPGSTYPINVTEPTTDVPRIPVAACNPQ